MKPGEQTVTYWVMYEERVQRNVAAWHEPTRFEWVLRTAQHYGTNDLETARDGVKQLQPFADNKTHYQDGATSGPESHHITEVWIEVQHRCRFEPNGPVIPNVSIACIEGGHAVGSERNCPSCQMFNKIEDMDRLQTAPQLGASKE